MLLMSRTKVLTDVTGISKTSSGKGPVRLFALEDEIGGNQRAGRTCSPSPETPT